MTFIPTWNRQSRLDATVKTIERRSRRMIRLAIVGVAVAAAGLVAPTATLADDATFDPPTQNERSIMMIESKERSGDTAFVPPTANERSIALIESKEASGETAFVPMTANERSIQLIESKEAPGGVLAGGVPDTVRFGDR